MPSRLRAWLARPARYDLERRAALVLCFLAAPILDDVVALTDIGRGVRKAAQLTTSVWSTKQRS